MTDISKIPVSRHPPPDPPSHPMSEIQAWFDETLSQAGDREILEQAGQLFEALAQLSQDFSDAARTQDEEKELQFLAQILDHYASRFKKNRVGTLCDQLDRERAARHLTSSVIAATGLASSLSLDFKAQLESRLQRYR